MAATTETEQAVIHWAENKAVQYLTERSTELSTKLSVAFGVSVSPLLFTEAGDAITGLLSGDYGKVFPFFIGIAPVIVGIVTKEKTIPDHVIHAAVLRMSSDHILDVLDPRRKA